MKDFRTNIEELLFCSVRRPISVITYSPKPITMNCKPMLPEFFQKGKRSVSGTNGHCYTNDRIVQKRFMQLMLVVSKNTSSRVAFTL